VKAPNKNQYEWLKTKNAVGNLHILSQSLVSPDSIREVTFLMKQNAIEYLILFGLSICINMRDGQATNCITTGSCFTLASVIGLWNAF